MLNNFILIFLFLTPLIIQAQISGSNNIYESGNYVGIHDPNPFEMLQIGDHSPFTFHDGNHDVLGFNYQLWNNQLFDNHRYGGEIRLANSSGALTITLSDSAGITPYWPEPDLSINSTGSGISNFVGVGLLYPSSKLHVKHENQDIQFLTNNNSNAYTLNFSLNDDGINLTTNTADRSYNFKNSLGTLVSISEDNVVIGNSTGKEDYLLSVEGRITSEGVLIEDYTEWPDYVFKEGYSLKSLGEVDSLIKKDNHLPGIPSSNSLKNGLNTGEMQRLQLEKTEELTMYLIQMQHSNIALKTKNETLENHQNSVKKHVNDIQKENKELADEIEHLKTLITQLKSL